MPFSFQPFGPPEEAGLPSWQDPRFNESASFGMTPEAIWNQALAQYEAGLKGGGYSPEELDRRFLAPARLATGRPEPESPWSGPIETAGGGIYQVNTDTGAMRVIRTAGEPKPTTIHSPDLGVIQVDNAGNVRTLVPPTRKDEDSETVTVTYPGTKSIEGVEGIIGSPGGFFKKAKPPTPPIPGIPGTPSTRIEYKRPRFQVAGTNAVPVALSPVQAPPIPTIQAPTIQPAGTNPLNEVTRRTKDGRLAVFDADTKQFIRYAD